MFKIAILASGNGTNAQAIIEKMKQGILNVEIPLIICNEKKAGIIKRAEKMNIPCRIMDHRDFASRQEHDYAMCHELILHKCDAVVLAGYMRLLSAVFFREFNGPVLNIHPALLPAFPGSHGIRDAYDYGVKITGVTVHFVEEKMDSGAIIIQAAACVKDDISQLESILHKLEHRIYPMAIQWLSEGRLSIKGREVILQDKKGAKKIQQESDWLVWPALEEGF